MKQFSRLKKFNVLVGTPNGDRKPTPLAEFIDNVRRFTHPNYDFLLADNSDTRECHDRLRAGGVDVVRIDPRNKSTYAFLAESHEALRLRVLSRGYDFLLHLESDVFPPIDIIERLLSHQKPMVSAMYPIGFGEKSHLLIQLKNENTTQPSVITAQAPYDFSHVDGQLKKIFSSGIGCCLIHRSVLEKVPFRYVGHQNAAPDTFFAADVDRLGIPHFLDTSIVCSHQNSPWLYF